ncbi:hypothetical protein GCM10017161_33170 [Thalassotalea marina]|uniref:Uncharacterized protein n=1 Tax=Thalassotalea marina TaxID=1673741 RepID=A0A919BMR1_9GAMM|nr:hypothetical protein GCM10017161_33170 [Thalassotalea marina]
MNRQVQLFYMCDGLTCVIPEFKQLAIFTIVNVCLTASELMLKTASIGLMRNKLLVSSDTTGMISS